MRNLLRTVVAACLLAGTAHAQDDSGAEGDKKGPTQAQVMQMLQQGDLEAAQKAIEAIDDKALVANLRRALLSSYLQKGDMESAFNVAAQDVNKVLENDGEIDVMLLNNLNVMASLSQRAKKVDEAMATVDGVIARLESAGDDQAENLSNALTIKVRLLQSVGKADEAAQLITQLLEKARQFNEEKADTDSLVSLLTLLQLASGTTRDAEAQQAYMNEALELSQAAIDNDKADARVVMTYGMITLSKVASKMDDAAAAEAELKQATETLNELSEKSEEFKRALTNPIRQLGSIAARIEKARLLEKLVGQPAPALDPAFWAHGEPMAMEDLKGKVVLLDFWAVWCGPCIATFPHLIEWQEEYGDRGFQVIGVTRKYNYAWNEEAKRASGKGQGAPENSDAEEAEMLVKFMDHHELLHPTMVVPKETKMFDEFGVSGIPHAVLIDREGNIQMIKVGSGQANADAIHAKIEELLAQ